MSILTAKAARRLTSPAGVTAGVIAFIILVAIIWLLVYIGVPLAIFLAAAPALGFQGLASLALSIVVFVVWWLILALLDRLRRK